MDEKKGLKKEAGADTEKEGYGTFRGDPGGKLGMDNATFMGDSTANLSAEPQKGVDLNGKAPIPEESSNKFTSVVATIQEAVHNAWNKNQQWIRRGIYILLVIGYFVYFGLAMNYEFGSEASIRLLWVTCVVVFFFLIWLIGKLCGDSISRRFAPCADFLEKHNSTISWITVAIIFLGVIAFVIVDVVHVSKKPYNLVSGSGLILYVVLFFIFSHSPTHVNWRAVAWGLGLQFVLALLILRWDAGYNAFLWLGERVTEFLEHADAGAIFVFGDKYTDHYFAFKILPVVVFFSTTVSVLYYLGWMQVVIKKIAFIMQYTMGTTAAESLNAAGNIFIGQSEAPLMIRPFIKDMTRSELHAVMTGGFATIAGSVLAAYILFGVPASHLISASVMSAPAALAMSKLFYPETEVSKTTVKDMQLMEAPKERNIIEAASAGASQSVKLVANIAANLIAFLAMLEFLNATLTWFGDRVGIEELTFQLICSYVLFPFALVMGIELTDCRRVAKLIGIKTFLNEFVAYDTLGDYINNRVQLDKHIADNGTYYEDGDDIVLVGTNITLTDGVLSARSTMITTFALCGFANFSSMGVMLGALGSMAPSRKTDLAGIALRAMIAGNVACFMTACIAGLLYQG